MTPRFLAIPALLVLAACHHTPAIASGSSGERQPHFASPQAEQNAESGCASGQAADLLHQNRAGGRDYDVARCKSQGY
jgi:hypothetical protein